MQIEWKKDKAIEEFICEFFNESVYPVDKVIKLENKVHLVKSVLVFTLWFCLYKRLFNHVHYDRWLLDGR